MKLKDIMGNKLHSSLVGIIDDEMKKASDSSYGYAICDIIIDKFEKQNKGYKLCFGEVDRDNPDVIDFVGFLLNQLEGKTVVDYITLGLDDVYVAFVIYKDL